MSQNIDSNSSDILRFRPVIQFVEPAQEPFPITPVSDVAADQPADIDSKRRQIKNFADALGLLAAAVQARIDVKCAGMLIKLDPNVDNAVIQAMRRQFPDALAASTSIRPLPSTSANAGGSGTGAGTANTNQTNTNPSGTGATSSGNTNQASTDPNAIGQQDGVFITYAQYKYCRDKIREYACNVAADVQSITAPDAVAKARQDLLAGKVNIGGVGTLEASQGGLRPELFDKAQVVKPLQIDQFQNELIKILVNYIWKHFLRPLLAAVLPFGLGNSLPQELIKVQHPLPESIPTLK